LGLRHVLNTAEGLAGDEHPLRLGGGNRQDRRRKTDQYCQEDGQTRCLRLHISRLGDEFDASIVTDEVVRM
jgi:hypothetical protein